MNNYIRNKNFTDEQYEATIKTGKNIIVSAGAGSGKTTVLKERVLRILQNDYFKNGNKVHINNLIILTFTKNAAAEMKERIRKIISKHEELKEESELLESSYITTFDSFAGSLVRQYNYLLNIDSDFNIIDDSMLDIEIDKKLDEILEKYYKENESKFHKFIESFCIKDDTDIRNAIKSIYIKLQNVIDRDKYLDNYINKFYNEQEINNLFDKYSEDYFHKRDDIATLFDNLCEETIDENTRLKNIDAISKFLNASSYDELVDTINFKLAAKDKKGSKYTDEGIKIKEEISTIKKNLKADLTEYKKELIEHYKLTESSAEVLINILKELDSEVMNFKKEHNSYTYTDIAYKAIDLVKNNESVRNKIKNNTYEIMIDEYQDTNDIQDTFISYIQNNNVYMVGDIKQSIYRFRNANPYIFKKTYDNYKNSDNGYKIDLNKNFRSRHEVVDNINLIFNNIMTDEIGGANYKLEHEMVFGNTSYDKAKDDKQDYNMQILNYEIDNNNYNKVEAEAFIIANDILDKINKHYKAYDEDGTLKDITYKNFCILVDKSKNFTTLKKILEYKHIPVSIDKDLSIKEDDEIYILKNVINLIIQIHENEINNINKTVDDKYYDYKLNEDFKHYYLSVARSYIYKIDDNTLFDIITNNKYKDTDLYKLCLNISKSIDSLDNKELLSVIIDKFDIINKLPNVGDIDERLTKLEYFINNANSLNKFGMDIYNLKDYFDELANTDNDLTMQTAKSTSNSVKIMTIHGSKGLEFNYVYLPYLYSDFKRKETIKRFDFNKEYGMILPFFDNGIGSTFIKKLYYTNNLLESLSEKIRLLYVAVTRAQEQFIMVTSFDNEMETPSEINYSNLSIANSYSYLLDLLRNKLNKYIKNINIDELNITDDYKKTLENNYISKIKATTDKITTEKIKIDSKPLEAKRFSKEMYDIIDENLHYKLSFGTYMHYIFEIYNFNKPNIDKLNISDEDKKHLFNFLAHDEVKDIKNAKVYKEHEIKFTKDNNDYHGFIDLLVEYPDHFDIIDYKLSNTSSPEYVTQLTNYKNYIETTYSKKTNIYLYSINKDTFKKL